MTSFLKNTAQFILDNFPASFDRICVVLPNRRAGLYLRSFLASGAGKPIWAPTILPVEDFLLELSGLTESDPVNLLFDLYDVHCLIEKEKSQPPDEFMRWGGQVLSDFNDLDSYLASPAELFSTLSEAKAISLWNPDGRPLTQFEKEYLRFFKSLGEYYNLLGRKLTEQNCGYKGLIFRKVAENIEHVCDNLPWEHVILAGFNAMTGAEEKIVDALRKRGLATLLWDADCFYLEDESQEAGEYLRKWMAKWPVSDPHWISDQLLTEKKEINVIGSPDPVGQVKFCGSLLGDLLRQGESAENTAVVFADMSLLMPMLNSLPAGVEKVNITAGIPLSTSVLAGLFEALFQAQLRISSFTLKDEAIHHRFYYIDVLKILQNPLVRWICGYSENGQGVSTERLTGLIRNDNRSFLGFNDICSLAGRRIEFLEVLFTVWTSPGHAVGNLKAIAGQLHDSIGNLTRGREGNNENEGLSVLMEKEFLWSYAMIFSRIGGMLEKYPAIRDLQTLYLLFDSAARTVSLPFEGEPLQGLQLMGMLETRTLGFSNLVLLSCNEDLLPGGKSGTSFIPHDIRQIFGLPLWHQNDAVYAYHFYRLIQHARRIWILYNTDSSPLGGGDPSRFIRQIMHELPEANPAITIQHSVLTTPTGECILTRTISKEKNDHVLSALMERAEKGFSATSLNMFRNCQLKFYFSEVEGIRKPEDMPDTIDPANLGRAIHDTLHELYLPLKSQPLSPSSFGNLLDSVEKTAIRSFENKFRLSGKLSGKNLLLFNVGKILAEKMVRQDMLHEERHAIEGAKHMILHLEEKATGEIILSHENKQFPVRIKGFLDRVDIVNETMIIIDYKTGMADFKNVNIKEWDDLYTDPALDAGFQLMLYTWLVHRNTPGLGDCLAGILPLRNMSDGLVKVKVPGVETSAPVSLITAKEAERFEEVLRGIVELIFNPSVPFSQTEDRKICLNCPYINLCAR